MSLSRRKKIFVLVPRVPYPLEKGDKLRAFHFVKHLSKSHDVLLCCLSTNKTDLSNIHELSKICTQVEIVPLNKLNIPFNLFKTIFTSEPFQVGFYYQLQAQKKINQLIDKFNPDHIYCQLIRTSEYVKNQFHYTKTIDYMDALSAGAFKRAEKTPWYWKPLVKLEAKRLMQYENTVFDYFDTHTIISKQDQQLIYHEKREQIHIISNGIDSHFFKPSHCLKNYDLVFTGNMSYPPNIDCALFLVNEILPIIIQEKPNIKLLIAGASPTNKVKKLASNNVTVSGWVNDIRTAYNDAKIFVAPLRIGSGLQNKLLEAMSMELPSVTSKMANNALQAENGESILIGDSAESYANHIIELLDNEDFANKIAVKGKDFVTQNYSWEQYSKSLTSIFSLEANSK